jgi:hypothetical protein
MVAHRVFQALDAAAFGEEEGEIVAVGPRALIDAAILEELVRWSPDSTSLNNEGEILKDSADRVPFG